MQETQRLLQKKLDEQESRHQADRARWASEMSLLHQRLEVDVGALDHKHRERRKEAGIKLFKCNVYRMVKGEAGERLMLWKTNTQQYKKQMAVLTAEDAGNVNLNKNRNLWAKEVSDIRAEYEEQIAVLTQQTGGDYASMRGSLVAKQQGSAMNNFKAIMRRMFHGEAQFRLRTWQMRTLEGLKDHQAESSRMLEDQILQVAPP